MVESGNDQDLKSQASGLRSRAFDSSRRYERAERFRYRFYLSLLVFVVVAGMPIVGIPVLRHRLSSRVQTFREAARPNSMQAPAVARVGENAGEFPKEYEIPVLPRASAVPYYVPSPDRVYSMHPPHVVAAPSGGSATAANEGTPQERETSSEPEPVYSKGKTEQEAYDVLVRSSETIAGMILGKDPSLRFKDWSAARTDEDTYLVRLVFTQVAEKADAPYIWQVRMSSKQVTPLSYSARSIPQ